MTNPIHPGQHVRETYLQPRNINVTEAAKLIGVSRPGVSNFLNGKVTTTSEMAARVERAFGIPAKTLLDMQAAYDGFEEKAKGAPANTKSYVPPFLSIKANDINGWVEHNISARMRLSVFLRTLVNSTGVGLEKVDFPGNDDAERAGWDGYTLAAQGTPWVPVGRTGWEFGVNADVKIKADGDFAKSVKATKKAERDQMVFAFVTPRRWPAKDKWASDMKAKKQWADVRAYDSSDLEQWLEQSPAAQAWIANETGRPSQGVRSLDKCWADWANVATPTLDGVLFKTAIDVAKDKVKGFLARPASEPMVIAADSVEEALAFLSQLFADADLAAERDRVLVFDQTGVLPSLASGTKNFIAIAHTRSVERELGPHASTLHAIIVYPRNATNSDPDIVLEPLGYEAFRTGMEAMGFDREAVTKYASASGRSLTVLRRQLANLEAVRTPEWAEVHKDAASWLVPFVLVGAWNAKNQADQVALSLLADGVSYDEHERRIQELLRLNDAPVWSIGGYRGVVSKIDALFAITGAITSADLTRYLELAMIVLGEDDPALDLPAKERWAAATYGKQREFSNALRDGISETLVLLAVHGKNLFKTRLGFDGEAAVENLVRRLLEPLTTRTLEANDRDLPVYAEAAPNEFLTILERDLKSDEPSALAVLKPVETGFFGVPSSRTGLLWALEGLAWNPETLLRSVQILGRLSEVVINDNLANKPIASLEAIFRAWMPQTAANKDQRLKAVNKLIEKFPSVGWKICLHQFGHHGNRTGHYSHKPKWRPDGYGFGKPLNTYGEITPFVREMVEIALGQTTYSTDMLCDLIERLHGLAPKDQDRVWAIIRAWQNTAASDAEIAKIREKIRETVLSRRGQRRGKDGDFAALTKTARSVYSAMEPAELTSKHEWLFRDTWVDESADELDDEEFDFRKRETRVEGLRTEALREILAERGSGGIFALSEAGKAQSQIGWLLVKHLLGTDQIFAFLIDALNSGGEEPTPERKNLIFGALCAMPADVRDQFFQHARTILPEKHILRLLLLAPFRRDTWGVVDALSPQAQDAYWADVIPDWIFEPEDDNNEAVERMIRAQRPRAAFAAVHFKLDAIRAPLLHKMLSGIAMDGKEKSGEYQLEEYDIKSAFSLLDKNPDVSIEEKAGLELAYIDVLARPFGNETQQIPNLERYIEAHPEMFVQAVVWAYKRKDRGEDPEDVRTPEGREDLANRGYRLLEGLERIPGLERDGQIDKAKLTQWVGHVRKSCAEVDRADVGDICLGKLLSSAPAGPDGVWPCEPVRDVMEDIQSEHISSGAYTGLYNSRGAVWRGEGGGQERELAAKYRVWAEALQFSHPHVASSLLMEMVKTYERQADAEDNEAGIRRRLLH